MSSADERVAETNKRNSTLEGKQRNSSRYIESPGPNDVLSGRGPASHTGNIYYRELVSEHKKEYVASSFHEKKKISEKIMFAIHGRSPPGKFLKQDCKSKLWYEMNRKDALLKIRKCLREGAAVVLYALTSESYNVQANKMKSEDHFDKNDKVSSDNSNRNNPQTFSQTIKKFLPVKKVQNCRSMRIR